MCPSFLTPSTLSQSSRMMVGESFKNEMIGKGNYLASENLDEDLYIFTMIEIKVENGLLMNTMIA
jgi:hypothetical protein